jgi:hypothetical protein
MGVGAAAGAESSVESIVANCDAFAPGGSSAAGAELCVLAGGTEERESFAFVGLCPEFDRANKGDRRSVR